MGKDRDKIKQALDLLIEADPGLSRKGLRAEPMGDRWVVRDQEGRTYRVGTLPLIAAWLAE